MICTLNTGCPVLGVHITLECLYLFVHLCIFSNLLIYSLNQKSQQVGRVGECLSFFQALAEMRAASGRFRFRRIGVLC